MAAPYRMAETPRAARERALEAELASTRQLLEAYTNEELRVFRRVLLREATQDELMAVRDALARLTAAETRLASELTEVRAEIAMRGERRVIGPPGAAETAEAKSIAALLGLFLALLALSAYGHLQRVDTARRPPPDAPLDYPGLLGPGETWLYVASDSAERVPVEVDGRWFPRPSPVAVSATTGHDVRFAGGPAVRVRWIPCTTAVVRFDSARRDASVDRYYNGATCL